VPSARNVRISVDFARFLGIRTLWVKKCTLRQGAELASFLPRPTGAHLAPFILQSLGRGSRPHRSCATLRQTAIRQRLRSSILAASCVQVHCSRYADSLAVERVAGSTKVGRRSCGRCALCLRTDRRKAPKQTGSSDRRFGDAVLVRAAEPLEFGVCFAARLRNSAMCAARVEHRRGHARSTDRTRRSYCARGAAGRTGVLPTTRRVAARTSEGEVPKRRRNARLKYERSPKPASNATVAMVCSAKSGSLNR
jgi:hypothetical protein